MRDLGNRAGSLQQLLHPGDRLLHGADPRIHVRHLGSDILAFHGSFQNPADLSGLVHGGVQFLRRDVHGHRGGATGRAETNLLLSDLPMPGLGQGTKPGSRRREIIDLHLHGRFPCDLALFYALGRL